MTQGVRSVRFLWLNPVAMSVDSGSKQHSLQAVDLSRRLQTDVQIVSKPPTPSNGGPINHFWTCGPAGWWTLFFIKTVVPKTTAYKRWNCHVIRPANCCHLIPSNRFFNGFPGPSQFAAAKRTHYSTMQHRHSYSSRPRQRLLLSGDVHQNPGPATKYPCVLATSQVVGLFCLGSFKVFWSSKCSGVLRIRHAALAVLHQHRNRFHH